MKRGLSVSVVIATAFRESELMNALRSLARQTLPPDEIIIVDGAPAPGIEPLLNAKEADRVPTVRYFRSNPPSAAVQRNAGAEQALGDLILFMDDDAYPAADCLEKIVQVFAEDGAREVGGVGVVISNQPCDPPSPRAKRWFDFLAGETRPSYSGAVIGPAINIGPQPTDDGRVVRVEWLNSGCTAYRREAFAAEKFCPKFHGYSFMEDVDLSVRVGRTWKLLVHTGASMYHDTQPSRFKAPYTRGKMSVCNRYHVMTESLGRRSWAVHGKFLAYFVVNLASAMIRARSVQDFRARGLELGGALVGMGIILPAVIKNLFSRRGPHSRLNA